MELWPGEMSGDTGERMRELLSPMSFLSVEEEVSTSLDGPQGPPSWVTVVPCDPTGHPKTEDRWNLIPNPPWLWSSPKSTLQGGKHGPVCVSTGL